MPVVYFHRQQKDEENEGKRQRQEKKNMNCSKNDENAVSFLAVFTIQWCQFGM